jgi:predicted ATPase
MEALTERLLAAAHRAPMLLLIEDAHWIDPSTLEFIDYFFDRIEAAPVLAVVTYRPEFIPRWVGRSFVTALTFSRLSGADCAATIRNLATQPTLSGELVDEILHRSDGVPLFIEELTKAVLEGGRGGSTVVPPTLQDSLMARLDRLDRAKDVAQIAAVIGREFSRPLLAEIVELDSDELERDLSQLVDSGIVFPRSGGPEDRYSFKHALLQEAAYESLLKSRRQMLHGRVGRALVKQFAATDSHPGLVALHFSRAGMADEASRYWELAGDRSMAQFSYAEAAADYEAALASARQLARPFSDCHQGAQH